MLLAFLVLMVIVFAIVFVGIIVFSGLKAGA
jgi:hypothetical protein